MKKLFCVILSLVVVISTANCAFSSAVQEEKTETLSAEKFALSVGNMVESYNSINQILGNELNSDEPDIFKTARLIVKSKHEINTLNATSVVSGYNDLWVLQFATSKDALKAYDYYSKQSKIEYVEPDREVNMFSDSQTDIDSGIISDKEYLSWGPSHIGIDKLNNSLISKGTVLTKTVVAVVDTGVDPNHPYLKGRVIPTRINTSSSGIRNDSMDDNGHGTQVAGVIVDSTLENIFIKPYKVIDNRGNGTLITIAAGINCAINDEVDVINVSLGYEDNSEVLEEAIHNAELNDILVIGAAGNNGTNEKLYPASYDSVLKITAVNESNVFANFSSFGDDIDFAAPGVSIKTTTLNNEYSIVKGTSFAAPFVTAIAATIKGIEPYISSEEIKEILLANAVEISEHNASIKYGNGVIRAPEAPRDKIDTAKTATPQFSNTTAFYNEPIDIEISCETPNATIYYTTDRSIPSKTNPSAVIYDGTPIHATQTIILMAVAYCDGMYRSSVASVASIIAPTADENELEIDADGNILSYNGTSKSITIPDTVNGIKVIGIGKNAFSGKDLTEVILPNSVTKIGAYAFDGCTNLKTLAGLRVTEIGDYALRDCIWLKNLFFSELTSIGKYSFANVCSKQYLISETTFTLRLEKLSIIPEGAFMGSAISSVDLGNINLICDKAFFKCNALVSVYIDNLFDMPSEIFKECLSLKDVDIKGNIIIPISAFDTCKNLIKVSFPDVKTVNANAFKDCVSLVEVDLPAATMVLSNAFNGCQSLRALHLPSMTNFEKTLYNQTKDYPLLPENLETFSAPKMSKTVFNMFTNAPNITYIYLNSATDIAEYTFRGCYKIYFINLESVTALKANSLAYCKAQFIDARNLITTADMPDNSGILLSNNFLESTDSATNLTVYGTPGTFVERYSKLKGYDFVEIPLIVNKLPQYVTENSESIYIFAVGFDLKYQWYWNTVNSTEGGTAIEGATTNSYTFTQDDTAPYYYCVITQNDLGSISKLATSVITKDTVPADYTAYNEAVEKAKQIDRSIYADLSRLDLALEADVSNRYSCEQAIVDAQTKAINNAIAALKIKVADTISLYASETKLRLYESIRIVPVIQPTDALYESIEYVSEDKNVIWVSESGYVFCIGDGSTNVKATVKNPDGSEISGIIRFETELSLVDKIIAKLLLNVFVFADNIGLLNKVFSYM